MSASMRKANSGDANTSKFLIQCLGRQARINADDFMKEDFSNDFVDVFIFMAVCLRLANVYEISSAMAISGG